MTRLPVRGLLPLAACVLALAATTAARAADEPMKSETDKRVTAILVVVIDKGVDLYNGGDPNGCYRLYEGALRGMRPFLDGKPEWQKQIDVALDEASRQPNVADRAFTLRKVMDKIYFEINPKKEPEPTKTLWDRLGGEKGVSKVIDDVVAAAAKDPKVNFDRDGKYKLDDAAVAKLKKGLVAWVSSQTGGPIKYEGKSMKEIHKGMGITDAEFDALAGHVKKALDGNGVKKEDAEMVMKAVAATRPDIVEPKQPEPAKQVDVKGTLTLDGKPLAKATVTLTPEKGEAVTAKTDDEGKFAAKAPAGTYKVGVKAEGVPAKYGDAKTSGLTATAAEGKDVKLELKGEKEKDEPKPDEAKTGTVSGKVAFEGKPVSGARVLFLPEKGNPTAGTINEDGAYSVDNLTPGKYKLAIVVIPDDKKPGVKLPEKYADPDKSGLTYDVKAGKGSFNIELK